MDFVNDLEMIAQEQLKLFGIDYSGYSGHEIVRMFVNLQSKLIPMVPRKVLRSQKFQHKIEKETCDKDIKTAVLQLEDKLRNGEDINPHLSTSIKCGDFTDRLLADWNIYHLHLSLENDPRELIDGKTFTKRTRDVLFLMISGDAALLIDIRPHGRHGEKYVFAQKELLQLVADNWPEVLEPLRMKGVTNVEFETDDPEKIERFRKLGIDIPYRINDAFYSSPGGLTMDSRSVHVTIETNCLYEMVERAMKWVNENRSKIDKDLSLNDNYDAVKANFRLILSKGEFFVSEETTQSVISFSR